TVVVGNDTLGGDPADGHIKRLHVEYTLSGKKYSQDVDEQGTLTIPDPKATPLADASLAPSAAVLVIVRASYEALDGGGSADVKDLLSKLITGNRLTVLVSNDTLGGDPAANHEKRLHIEYTLDGKQYSRDVAEQGTLTIPDPNAAKPDAGK
ncbi:MAG: hypothetical protein P4L33_10905, partial [Capsulimonadaceae bacterium]|nr:hypothetical protein [Capsulimonadaceae bacterium]